MKKLQATNDKNTKVALITGVNGQDGAYLAKFLLNKGYQVWGTSRDVQGNNFTNLRRLGIFQEIKYLTMVPEDFRSVFVALKRSQAHEVYYLAGQSSVGLSFEQPAETMQSIALGTLNILESCKLIDTPIRLYHAGSSECFGDTQGIPANETTSFHPRSPYAVAKSSAFWLVDNYREAYNLFACTGILFNHESPLRPIRFVTQKIISTAYLISQHKEKNLHLGRLDIARDWGWAPEYVEAMWLILQQDHPKDYIIATGITSTLETFVDITFKYFDLDWHDHVIQDQKLFRPTDLQYSCADPSKANLELGWNAKYRLTDIIKFMIDDIQKQNENVKH